MLGYRWRNSDSIRSRFVCAHAPDDAACVDCPGGFRRGGSIPPGSSGGSAAVNFIGALLESDRKTAKGGVEHRSHQGRKSAAPEFVVDEKFNVTRPLFDRIKGPAILHALERAIEVFDQDLQ